MGAKEPTGTEVKQLSTAIGHVEGEVENIEKVLGLGQDIEAASKEPGYDDVPRRLDQLVQRIVNHWIRLSAITKVVIELKETVG